MRTSLLAFAAAIALPLALFGEPVDQPKRVEIDKTRQILRAYEGDHLFLETHVSTGAQGAPPVGHYSAGEKYLMHYSRLFHNAPMPYSIQLSGNFFIHGFSYVPAWPASHGCVRVPLDHDNPAKKLFEWIEPGTPIEVSGHWEK